MEKTASPELKCVHSREWATAASTTPSVATSVLRSIWWENEVIKSSTLLRFSQEMWKGLTGRGLYHSCGGQCLNYSQPCEGNCMPGTQLYLLFNNVSSDILDGLMVRLLAVWLQHRVHPVQHRPEGLQHVQPLWRQTGLRGQIRWGLAGLSSGQSCWIFLHFFKTFISVF